MSSSRAKGLRCPYANSEAIERRYVELSGQLHAPANVTLEKEPKVTLWLWGSVGPTAGLDA